MENSSPDENARLAPLKFMEGDWEGNGKGPYGPYKVETHVERRGRWLLMTSAIRDAKTDDVTYVSTQVYGYDDQGLTLSFFDTAGSFDFRGGMHGDELRFDYTEGENSKRSQYWRDPDGKIRFRYESVYPKKGTELYEGRYTRAQSSRLTRQPGASPNRSP